MNLMLLCSIRALYEASLGVTVESQELKGPGPSCVWTGFGFGAVCYFQKVWEVGGTSQLFVSFNL